MKKIELLAPAGNMESLIAAIEAGCDAVYLGGYMFGARSFAGNFSNEEIIEAVNYAHLYGVKVYVTVNTLIYEDEVDTLLNYVDFLHKNNVDAVIIQDIGMMDLLKQTYPNLEIHASTQMHIHNLEGVKLIEELGLARVVLARETNIDEIKNIRKNTNLALEVFIHGALCISYSGQCLMSSLIGRRSGNRGTCAQCCRQRYDLIVNNQKVNQDEYLLSTKDLNTLDYIGELIDAGVDSLKIEGRMKRPEYVYLVVSLYRKAIDSYLTKGEVVIANKDIIELKKIFNRGFTKGFLFNETNKNIVNQYRPNHMGIEIGEVISSNNDKVKIKLSSDISIGDGIRIIGEKEDTGLVITKIFVNGVSVTDAHKNDIIEIKVKDLVKKNSKVLKTTDIKQLDNINQIIKQKLRKVLINGKVEIKKDEAIKLQITDNHNMVEVSLGKVETAINSPITASQVEKQITKLGGTPYQFNKLDIELDDNVFVNITTLNEIRRQAISMLSEKRLYQISYKKKDYYKKVNNFERERNVNILITNIEQYEKIKDKNFKLIYVEDEVLYEQLKDDKRVTLKLPRVVNKFKEYNQLLLVGELGSVRKYSNINTDFSLNVTNSYSVAFLHNLGVKTVTLSYELNDRQIEDIMDNYHKRYNCHPNLELIIYGLEEAMISKFNLLDYFGKNNNGDLKDRFNNLYPVKIKNNLMYIYNYKPRKFNNINKYYEMGINNLRINLLDEKDPPKI